MGSYNYLFGPVPSRRLGRSLGINIVPSKICSMDCIYCEAGRTKGMTLKRRPYFRSVDILEEFSKNYRKFQNEIDVITITGAGEPTLNSEFHEILKGIKKISSKPVAILTNSSLITDKEVYAGLLDFDIVVPSLDSVVFDSFCKVNRPHPNVLPLAIFAELKKFSEEFKGRLLVEVLFCRGVNDSKEDIDDLISSLKKLKNATVQIGTVYRPPAYKDALPVTDEWLLSTAKLMVEKGINAQVSGAFKSIYKDVAGDKDLKSLIINLTKLRPCTEDDMRIIFGASEAELGDILKKLTKDGELVKSLHNNEFYYSHQTLARLKE